MQGLSRLTKPPTNEDVTREEVDAAAVMLLHAIGEMHARTEQFANEVECTRGELE